MGLVRIPQAVIDAPPESLLPVTHYSQVELFLRLTRWGLKKYPINCPAELRWGTWELENVPLVALLLRLARSDASTYDCQIDARTVSGIRTLQCLATQSTVLVHLATDRSVRTLRLSNPAFIEAGFLVDKIRSRPPWTAEQARRALARLNTLYPTAVSLWWSCGPGRPRR